MVRDVEPGEVVVLTEDGPVSRNVNILARHALCSFELIYFARPDSVIDGVSVDLFRREAGRRLARRSSVEADIVVGVPDSGLSAAQGFAEASGIPYAMGLMKNRYIPRTFIQPTQGQREQSVRIKLNAMGSTVRGKRVILVDDSIVRGTTSARLVKLLPGAGRPRSHGGGGLLPHRRGQPAIPHCGGYARRGLRSPLGPLRRLFYRRLRRTCAPRPLTPRAIPATIFSRLK